MSSIWIITSDFTPKSNLHLYVSVFICLFYFYFFNFVEMGKKILLFWHNLFSPICPGFLWNCGIFQELSCLVFPPGKLAELPKFLVKPQHVVPVCWCECIIWKNNSSAQYQVWNVADRLETATFLDYFWFLLIHALESFKLIALGNASTEWRSSLSLTDQNLLWPDLFRMLPSFFFLSYWSIAGKSNQMLQDFLILKTQINTIFFLYKYIKSSLSPHTWDCYPWKWWLNW